MSLIYVKMIFDGHKFIAEVYYNGAYVFEKAWKGESEEELRHMGWKIILSETAWNVA